MSLNSIPEEAKRIWDKVKCESKRKKKILEMVTIFGDEGAFKLY
jgi:hypothetical protein